MSTAADDAARLAAAVERNRSHVTARARLDQVEQARAVRQDERATDGADLARVRQYEDSFLRERAKQYVNAVSLAPQMFIVEPPVGRPTPVETVNARRTAQERLQRDHASSAACGKLVTAVLQQVEEKETTELAWRDTFESWQALLRLRSQILVQRGQAVLDCILADEKVLVGLGAAAQLYRTVGSPPHQLPPRQPTTTP